MNHSRWTLGFLLLSLACSICPVAVLGQDEPNMELIQMIRDLVRESDRDMRALGLQQIRDEVPGEAATKQFAGLLPSLPPDGQAALLRALGDRGDVAARPAILTMLDSSDDTVRAAAVIALGALGGAADVPLLAARATKGSPRERAAVATSLVRLRGKEVNAAIVKELATADPDGQALLLVVLGQRNATESLPTVLAAARDFEPAARLAALGALRLLAKPENASKLVQVLKTTENNAQRHKAELALLAVCTRGREKVVEALNTGLQGADAANKIVLLRALARASGDAALQSIICSLEDSDEAVKDEAVRMLSVWPDPAVGARLLELAGGDNPRHQVLAIRGLARLTDAHGYQVDASLLARARPLVTRPADAIVPSPPAEPRQTTVKPSMPTPASMNLVEVEIPLPAPAFRGTPKPREEPFVEEPSGKPRGAFLAPEGTENLARGKPVSCSDPIPTAGELDLVTDGEKAASDFGYLELHPGTQWIQIDLGQRATVYAVVVWHNHAEARVYRDVVVQVSDDPDVLNAVTVFNDDYDNSSGLGIGDRMGYVETSEGKLIDCRGVEGRYVRLHSRGNHIDNKNHYTEVDVYGRPAP